MGQRVSLPLIIGDDGLSQCLREIDLTEWSRRWEEWRIEQTSGTSNSGGQRRELRVDQETIQKIIEPIFSTNVTKMLLDIYEACYRNVHDEMFTVDAFEFFGTLSAFSVGSLRDKVTLWFDKKNFGTNYKTVHSLQWLMMLSSITKGIYYLSFIHPPPVAYLEKFLSNDQLFTVDEAVQFLESVGNIYLGNFNNVQAIHHLRKKMTEQMDKLNEEMKHGTDDNILEPRQGKFITELPYREAAAIWKKYVSYDPVMLTAIQESAEERCLSVLGTGFSKTRESDGYDREPFVDHKLYCHRSLASRDDLVLMLIPAMVCNLLDPYGSDLLSARHYAYLSDLCALSGLFNLPPIEDLVPSVNANHGTFTAEKFIIEAAVFTLLEERRSYERYLMEEFAKYDADSSGTVERNELEQTIRELIGSQIQLKPNEDPALLDLLIQVLCEEVLEEVDEDNSEIVSFDEFKKGIRIIQHKFQVMATTRLDGLLPVVESMLGARSRHVTVVDMPDEEEAEPEKEEERHERRATLAANEDSSDKEDWGNSEQSDDDDNSGSDKKSSGSDHGQSDDMDG